jgi:hypothetical protein
VQRWNLAEFGAWKTSRHEDPNTSNNDDYCRHTLINVCGLGLGNREMLISAQARKAVQGPAADAKEFRRRVYCYSSAARLRFIIYVVDLSFHALQRI